MKDSALRAARPRASYDIAREIADMLFVDDGVSGEAPPAAGSGGETGGLSGEWNGVEEGEAGGAAAEVVGVAKGAGERAPERIGVPA